VWLNPQDTIRIGPYKLVMGEDQFTRYDETEGLRVEAYHLNKWVRKDLNLLQDISLVYQPREFIVVVGQSGGGKSTLVDAIAGYRPATHGKVFVNGIDVYHNFDAVRNDIGYVPQKKHHPHGADGVPGAGFRRPTAYAQRHQQGRAS
jgi:ABC-type transport system involved in cytochrome bd biosynthesis fused ATPase/permease subunit